MKIKFLLSDLDGVIRKYSPERAGAIEQKHGLQRGAIFAAAFEKTLLSQVVCGLITDEVWRSETAMSLSRIYEEKIAIEAIREWSSFSGTVDHRYLDHVELKFSGIPVALLTNGTTKLMSDLVKLGIQSRFFKIFNTAEIGVCKPDKKIFQHVMDDLGCKASEILFVDDSLSHVQVAGELGMVIHHYQSFETFQDAFPEIRG